MAKIRPKSLGRVTLLRLTQELYDRLKDGGLTTGDGGYQQTCQRILACVRTTTGQPVASATDRDLTGLRGYANRLDGGGWQDWARAVLQHNGL
jgi:hypothetical protein